ASRATGGEARALLTIHRVNHCNGCERSCLMSRFRRLLLIPLLGVGLLLAGVLPTHASSHREAPLISEDPVADDTDAYAFVSPDRPDTVTLIGNWIPLEEPAGGPNFYKFGQDVLFQFRIDNNADAVPDIIY